MNTYRCPCCGDGIGVKRMWCGDRSRLVCVYCERSVTLVSEEES